MADQLTNYSENKLADWMRGQGRPPYPTNWYIAAGSAASDTGITEITGLGLTRSVQVRSLANFAGTQGAGTTLASTGTSHATSNNAQITLGTPSGSGTITHIGFFDAASAGNCWLWLPMPGGSLAFTSGSPSPVTIAAGALQLSFRLNTGATDYLSNKVIDDMFRGQAFAWPATSYLGLYTAAPTNAGGGSEASVGGYARAALESSLAAISGTQAAGSTTASSGTSGRISNNTSFSYPVIAAELTTAAEGAHDAATLGNLLFWGSIVKTIPAGLAPSHAPDSYGITID